jgi:hypothetical protein
MELPALLRSPLPIEVPGPWACYSRACPWLQRAAQHPFKGGQHGRRAPISLSAPWLHAGIGCVGTQGSL